MLNQVFTTEDLDELRRDLLGASATVTFYSVTPLTGKTEIKQLSSGWHLSRKLRQPNRDVDGTITLILSSGVDLNINEIREQAVIELKLNRTEPAREYRIAEVTETQQIGGGYVLHCEPVSNTI